MGKDTVVPGPRPRASRWKTTGEILTLPFRAVGLVVYEVVQGPRMLAEVITFGNRGESFQRMDSCPCPRRCPLWRPHPLCPEHPDECWVPPTR